MSLFNNGNFGLHSGHKTSFKIDCDDLFYDDLSALAALVTKVGFVKPFRNIFGVATGGASFAKHLLPYRDTKAPGYLIVDDVLTTGASMEEQLKLLENNRVITPDQPVQGLVIFARGKLPDWVKAIFTLNCDDLEKWS